MICSIFLISLMKKLSWRNIKGFSQSYQILCHSLEDQNPDLMLIFGAFSQLNPLQKVLGITVGVHWRCLSGTVNPRELARWKIFLPTEASGQNVESSSKKGLSKEDEATENPAICSFQTS